MEKRMRRDSRTSKKRLASTIFPVISSIDSFAVNPTYLHHINAYPRYLCKTSCIANPNARFIICIELALSSAKLYIIDIKEIITKDPACKSVEIQEVCGSSLHVSSLSTEFRV